jgi:hypothetical protein
MANGNAHGLQPDVLMLLEGFQTNTTESLPCQHADIGQQEQTGNPQHCPVPGPDFQQQRGHQGAKDQSCLVSDL